MEERKGKKPPAHFNVWGSKRCNRNQGTVLVGEGWAKGRGGEMIRRKKVLVRGWGIVVGLGPRGSRECAGKIAGKTGRRKRFKEVLESQVPSYLEKIKEGFP